MCPLALIRKDAITEGKFNQPNQHHGVSYRDPNLFLGSFLTVEPPNPNLRGHYHANGYKIHRGLM